MSIQASSHLLLAAVLLLVASSASTLAASVDTANSPSSSSSSSSNATTIAVSVVGGVGVAGIALFVGYLLHTRRRSITPHTSGEKSSMPRSSSLSPTSSSSPSPGKISRYLAFWSTPSPPKGKGRLMTEEDVGLSGSTRGGSSTTPSPTSASQRNSSGASGLTDADRERRAGHRTSGRWSIPYPYPAAPSPIYAPDAKYLSASSRERMTPHRSKTPERGMSTDSLGGGSVYDEVHLETVPSHMSNDPAHPHHHRDSLSIPEEDHIHPDVLAGSSGEVGDPGSIRESAFFGYQGPLGIPTVLPGMERASSVPVDPQLLTLHPAVSSSSNTTTPSETPKRFSLGLGLKDLGEEMRRVISGGERKEDEERKEEDRPTVIMMDSSSPMPEAEQVEMIRASPMETAEAHPVQTAAPMEWSFGQGRKGLPRLTTGSDGEEEVGEDEERGGRAGRRREMALGAPRPQRASFHGVMSWEAGANLQRSSTLRRSVRTATRRTTASPTMIQSSNVQEEDENEAEVKAGGNEVKHV
ncbi:hypothetical protein BJ684DRAFT_21212 [Piptocephalis cylindrospora]|uniref:Uncharacterized protein n=1 Tax=Piptocephalis cylindrospora TaxID=1907219 RepID=A0A4P9Y0F7_9FUNG|nr:hypothetical protein BJ684DRAFT_21212 [Piptocephalis cylindrospora]|eukprot:RKP12235.1 hypothetical protein BJ684DRAFT_21212 [Piptocephalis cylindrospora]